ncbi:MAG: hypothetical protein ACI4W6_04145 [Acutalibacteraceae bacterium]
MSIEEKLKKYILQKYRSIREFSFVSEIPYSTIDNIFKRGVSGTGMSTIMKICDCLGISIDSLSRGLIEEKSEKQKSVVDEKTQIAFNMYQQLDSADQAEIRGEMKQMLKSPKYSPRESKKNA